MDMLETQHFVPFKRLCSYGGYYKVTYRLSFVERFGEIPLLLIIILSYLTDAEGIYFTSLQVISPITLWQPHVNISGCVQEEWLLGVGDIVVIYI